VLDRERLDWFCRKSHLLQGGPDGQAGSVAVPQWCSMACSLQCYATPAQMKVRDGVCRSSNVWCVSEVTSSRFFSLALRDTRKERRPQDDPGRIHVLSHTHTRWRR
jgi:hypothetical protein